MTTSGTTCAALETTVGQSYDIRIEAVLPVRIVELGALIQDTGWRSAGSDLHLRRSVCQ